MKKITVYNRYKTKRKSGTPPNLLPSLTIPDQSLSIMDILSNQKRGLPFPQHKVEFSGDQVAPMHLDKVERKQLHDELENEMELIKTSLDQQAKEKQKKAQERSEKAKKSDPEATKNPDEEKSTNT